MNRLRPWTAAVAAALALPATASAVSWTDLCRAGAAHFAIDRVIAGGEDADDDHTLYQPTDIAVDAAGNLLVLDYKLSCVKRFSPEGAYLGSFAREGAGPGELRGAVSMTVTTDGRTVIYELNNRRFSVFDVGGEHLESVGWFEGLRMCSELASASNGRLWAEISEPDQDYRSGQYSIHLAQLDAEFHVVGVIDSLRTRVSCSVQWDDGGMIFFAPFHETLEWCVLANGGVAAAHSSTYRIILRSPDGEIAATLVRNVTGPAVTNEDKSDYFASVIRGDMPVAVADAVRGAVEFPKRKPVLGGLWGDPAGYLIVEVVQPFGETPRYDVFDSPGNYVGDVAIDGLPRQWTLAVDGAVYGVRESEEDLPRVNRYRLVTEASGSSEE